MSERLSIFETEAWETRSVFATSSWLGYLPLFPQLLQHNISWSPRHQEFPDPLRCLIGTVEELVRASPSDSDGSVETPIRPPGLHCDMLAIRLDIQPPGPIRILWPVNLDPGQQKPRDDRRRLLREKLSANRQRRARDSYLEALPSRVATAFEDAPSVLSPQFEQLFDPWMLIHPDGLGSPPEFRPPDYSYSEHSSPRDILDLASSLRFASISDHCYFFPFTGNPAYRLKTTWVLQHLGELWPFSPATLGLVTVDFESGIVISHYCGYLQHDPNPDEYVYEFAYWGTSK